MEKLSNISLQFSSVIHAEHYPLLIFFIIAVFLGSIIFAASFFLAVQKPDSEKLSPYECGFEPFDDARNTFDVRFYLIGILFLIFDLEVMFLFPWAVSLSKLPSIGYWSMMDFLLEFVVGYAYVWRIGALEWD
jgi:NADH-quinone oxidoreductase subunit A